MTDTGYADLRRRLRTAAQRMRSLGYEGFETLEEAANALEAAESLLREVNEKGLIYWEPNTYRGTMAKADMMVRIDDWLAQHATAQRKCRATELESSDDGRSRWVCPDCGPNISGPCAQGKDVR